MRIRSLLDIALRLALGVFVLVIGGLVLVAVVVAVEGRSTFPAPLTDDAAIARHMPDYRYRDAYEVGTDAEPALVWALLRSTDLRAIPTLRVYLETWEAPGRLASAFGGDFHRPAIVTIDTLAAAGGFGLLEEIPGKSLVLGYIGQPWDASAPRPPFTRDSFARFRTPGYVRSSVSIEVVPRTGGGSRAIVEWRTSPTDTAAMREFGRYWTVRKPLTHIIAKTGLRGLMRPLQGEALLTQR